jgi:hypothetical protein
MRSIKLQSRAAARQLRTPPEAARRPRTARASPRRQRRPSLEYNNEKRAL